MSRTQAIFAAIISLTVTIVCAAIGFSFLAGDDEVANDDNGGFSTPANAPADAVLVSIASSNTKRNWLDVVVEQFNNEGLTTADGTPIVASVSHVTSGGSMNAILDGSLEPIVWSPGDSSWVDQANATWQIRNNRDIASQACQPTVYAPLGFAMWRPMAEALGWPDTPIGWDDIVKLASDPDGWANPAFNGSPQWGEFRFGHTHPAYANSGLLSMTGFVHGVVGTGGQQLTAAQVYEAEEAMQALEQVTAKYGRQAPALLELMAREGPSYLHAAAVPEADTVRFNVERGDELALGGLAFIFPKGGTIWADHPYCVLDNADWVDETEAEAGRVFYDYLTARPQQELAIESYLRPLDTSIPLGEPLTLANGTDPNVSPDTIVPLPSPDQAVAESVIDLFQIAKRKATIVLVLDTSGSMQGERISTATAATVEFLDRLDPDDEVAVMSFSDEAFLLAEPSRVGDVAETLKPRISTLIADGNTALYNAVCEAKALVEDLQEQDIKNGESRLYGVVLLSDGEDTVGRPTEGQMFATCLPTNAEADGVKVFPIAFGGDADEVLLERVAAVTGGRMFTASPESIGNIYISISAEQ